MTNQYPTSGAPNLSPYIIGPSDILVVTYFLVYQIFKYKSRMTHTRIERIRFIALMVCICLSICTSIYNILTFSHARYIDILRPFLIVLMFRSQRSTTKLLCLNIKDSLVILSCIFLFMVYWSYTLYVIFQRSFEGEVFFHDLTDSFWTGIVFLSTENYPFVMFFAQR